MAVQLSQESSKRTYFGLDKRSFLTFIMALLGWTLVNVDSASFNMTYPIIQKELGITDTQIGYLYSLMFIFAAIAVYAVGPAMDRFGRRKVFIGTLWATAIGSVFSGVAATFGVLALLRVVVSMGSSTEMSSGQVMLAETADARSRNFFLGIAQIGYPLGFFIAALVTKLVVPSFGWRVVFFIGIIPILAVLFVRRRVGETDRFLDIKHAREKAKKLADEKHTRLGEVTDQVNTEYKVDKKKALKNAYLQLFSGDLARTSILLALWQVLACWGGGSITSFMPMVLAYHKIPIEGLWFVTMTTMGLTIVGYAFSAWLCKKFSAKMVCVVFGTIGGLAGIYLAFYATTLTTITIGYLFYYFFAFGLYGAAPAVMTESFPTRVRGTGVAFAGGAVWLGYGLTGFIMPVLFKAVGVPGSVLIWTCIATLLSVVCLLGTKSIPPGTELEEIAS